MKSTKLKTNSLRENQGWIAELTDSDLLDVPVTFSGEKVVSRARDLVWDFSSQMDRRNQYIAEARIDWSRPLINGVILTDGNHDTLLIELKRSVLSFLTQSRPTICRQPKPHTIFHSQWTYLRRLAAFLTSSGLKSLKNLKARDIGAYYQSLKDATSMAGPNVGSSLHPHTMYQYATITNRLWDARKDIGIQGIAEPWPEKRLRKFYGLRKQREAVTPIIPEPAIRSMLDLAFELIENRLATIVKVQKKIHIIKDQYDRTGSNSDRKVRAICRHFGYENGYDFQREKHLCRAACIAVILFFSGIRESELISLQRNCYRPRKIEGVPAHGILAGQRFKGREQPEMCEWSVPEIVGVAVRGLMGLTALIRRGSAISPAERNSKTIELNVDIARSQGALLVTHHRKRRTGRATVMTGHLVRADLQLLSIAAGCHDENGDPWMLSCHQFRRTFAYMIARHQLGDIRYLRYHLGHGDVETTIYYCAGALTDDALMEEVAEERRKLQSALMDRWLDPATPLSGGRGREIVSRRIAVNTVVDRTGFSTALANNMRIRGTGHSYCTNQGDGCGGEGLYDAIRCADCTGAVIGEEFLPVWQALCDQQREIVGSGELGIGLQMRAAEQLAACESVIADLRGHP